MSNYSLIIQFLDRTQPNIIQDIKITVTEWEPISKMTKVFAHGHKRVHPEPCWNGR